MTADNSWLYHKGTVMLAAQVDLGKRPHQVNGLGLFRSAVLFTHFRT